MLCGPTARIGDAAGGKCGTVLPVKVRRMQREGEIGSDPGGLLDGAITTPAPNRGVVTAEEDLGNCELTKLSGLGVDRILQKPRPRVGFFDE